MRSYWNPIYLAQVEDIKNVDRRVANQAWFLTVMSSLPSKGK